MKKILSVMTLAIIDTIVSFGLAQLFVQVFGWRWTYMVEVPLDVSTSILGYTLMLGVTLPIVGLLGSVILVIEVPKIFASIKGP